jgi:hypothetical protein
LSFSPDGRRLLTTADKVASRVWDVATGLPLTEPIPHEGPMLRAWFLAGRDEILTATHRGVLARFRFWEARAAAPAWLPEMAEALAGRRLDPNGGVHPAPVDVLDRLRNLPRTDRDFYDQWARWYFSNERQTSAVPWGARASRSELIRWSPGVTDLAGSIRTNHSSW